MRNKYRNAVMKELSELMMMPKDISSKTRIRPTHVSRAIRQLRKRELVVCVNPAEIAGRIYKLTSQGRQVAENMRQVYDSTELNTHART